MQTHKFKWKLFDVEYSSVKFLDFTEEIRLDSDYYEKEFIYLENNINNKKYEILSNLSDVKWWKRLPKWEDFSKEWIPYVRVLDIHNVFIDYDNVLNIDYNLHNLLKTYQIKNRDILISIVWSIWVVWYNQKDYNKCNFTENCAKITSINVIQEYLLIVLLSKIWQLQVKREKVWTSQEKLSLDRLRKFKIPIPSTIFQQKIQELVIESYKQKELSEKLYKEAEELLLKELDLFDYKTKTKNIDLTPNYNLEIEENHSSISYSILKEFDRFDAEYWDYDFVEIKKRVENIKSEKLWDLVKYKKWIEVWSEAYIQESEVEIIEDKKYFVRVSNFSKNWINFNNAKFIKNDNFEKLKDYQPQKWEILFSKDWTAWMTYLLREDIDWIISGWILRFQNISNISSEYLELVLNSVLIQKKIERQTNWALIQHLKIIDALDFDIPIIWDDNIEIITEKIKQSFEAKIKSKKLLEVAKKSVEIYIEEDEEKGFDFIESNV